MEVRYRPLHPKDIGKCVEYVARHPILGRRYGKLIEHLAAAIRAAQRDSYIAINVFEEVQRSAIRFLGPGMAVFVSEDFLSEAKTTPFFWLGPELVKRIKYDKSPLLSDTEIRDANSTARLNLMVWHTSFHPADIVRIELGVAIMTAFEETFRGFLLKEIFSQADSLEQFNAARDAGGLYFDRRKGGYGRFPELDGDSFSAEPQNFGMTRELALSHGSSWIGSFFVYGPPRVGFSQSEQRLLLSALGSSGTDEELSEGLGVSLAAVKKAWRSIYDRVATRLPELIPPGIRPDGNAQSRGRQKKQRLLAYLREHPEELRPVSRKLLQGNAALH